MQAQAHLNINSFAAIQLRKILRQNKLCFLFLSALSLAGVLSAWHFMSQPTRQKIHDWQRNSYRLWKRTRKLSPNFAKDVTEHFDIVINAFRRDKALSYAVKHYSSCTGIGLSQIHVIWNDHEREVPETLLEVLRHVSVFRTPDNKITYRFWPLNFTSDAVFHVDDDTYYSCFALRDMFQLWRSDTDGMVGAQPRKMRFGMLDCWRCPITTGEYNMIFITKGAFIHRRFFDLFWMAEWKPMRDIADHYVCAEDILFGWMFLVASGSVDRLYAIAGTTNAGGDPQSFLTLDASSKKHYIVKDYTDDVSRKPYAGLNSRTWTVRENASIEIGEQIRIAFPKLVKEGLFEKLNFKWWRSIVNWALTCRGQGVACYNRVWDECSSSCDVVVRGQSACFTSDSACWAGNMYDTPMFADGQSIMICTDNNCQGSGS